MQNGWLLFIHHLPPQPAYVRVKVGRRLQKMGAVQLKNTVYVLPSRDEHLANLRALRREVLTDGGEATVCEARFLDGQSDADVVGLFEAARAPEWERLIGELRKCVDAGRVIDAPVLRRRFTELERRDFFPANSVARASALLVQLTKIESVAQQVERTASVQGRSSDKRLKRD